MLFCLGGVVAQNTNACGVCNVLGASDCKGHCSRAYDNKIKHIQFLELAPVIGKEWQLSDNGCCVFDNFNQKAAVQSIQLDPREKRICVYIKEDMGGCAIHDVALFISELSKRAELHGSAVENIEGGVCIDMSKSPNQFSGLVFKLMAQNLMPATSGDVDAVSQVQKLEAVNTHQHAPSIAWPPTPSWASHSTPEDPYEE